MFRVQQTLAKKREAKERNKSRQKLHELMMRQEEGGRRRRDEKEVVEISVLRMVMVMAEIMGRQTNSMLLNIMILTVKVDDLSLMLKRDGDATIPRRS